METSGPDTRQLICIIGPTASGKTARAIAEAETRNGEVISVDSRQVYLGLDIGTEKISQDEMAGIPHHLIDIRDAKDSYSAGDFVQDATRLIGEIRSRGKEPILAGGSHFYFDALLNGLPEISPQNDDLRMELEKLTTEELYEKILTLDPRRAAELDPQNRRRLVRAIELAELHGSVPERIHSPQYTPHWIVINPPREQLRARIDARLEQALARGLVAEVERVRTEVGDERLNELGLEYKIVGEYLRGERSEASLLPTLSVRLWHYARRQKAWIRKLTGVTNSGEV